MKVKAHVATSKGIPKTTPVTTSREITEIDTITTSKRVVGPTLTTNQVGTWEPYELRDENCLLNPSYLLEQRRPR